MNEPTSYTAPRTIGQAAAALRGGDCTILAGGTDLMPQTSHGTRAFGRKLVNITRIAQMQGVRISKGALYIGALTTITELMNDDVVLRHVPILAAAADHFASDQIRNVATLGGNICNASPAGDMAVPLLALDARVELVSKPDRRLSRRSLPLCEFFLGPGRTAARPDELLTAVEIPVAADGCVSRFFKFGTRPALDISMISIALAAARRDSRLVNVRVALGAVAPVPMRARRTEEALEGKRLDPHAIERAAQTARKEITPISDVRGSAWYRREMIHNVITRILNDVIESED